MAVIELKNCVLSILDGAAHSIAVKIGTGNFTYSETKNRIYDLDRGVLDTVRDGDEAPMEISFDFKWEEIQAVSTTAEGTPTVEDVIKQRGEASGWTSTGGTCEPYCVDLQIVHTPDCASNNAETYLFPDFRYESLSHDINSGQVSSTGKSNATEPTITRG